MARDKMELIAAAGEVLGRTGFQDTSMEDLANAIGVPRTALYYHFGGKGDILAAILQHSSDEAQRKIVDIAEFPIPPLDRFRLVVRALLLHNLENPAADLASVHHVDSPLLSDEQRAELVAKRDKIDQLVKGLLADAVADGSIRPVHVGVVSKAILTAIGRLQSWFRRDGELSTEEVVAVYVDFFVTGLAPANAPGPSAAPRTAAPADPAANAR